MDALFVLSSGRALVVNNGFPPIAQYSPTLAFESIIHDLYLCAGRGGRAVDTGREVGR